MTEIIGDVGRTGLCASRQAVAYQGIFLLGNNLDLYRIGYIIALYLIGDIEMHIRTAKDVGVLVRVARRSQKWTQSELAGRAGTTQKWVSHLENSRPGAPLDQVLRVLTVLGVKLNATFPMDLEHSGDPLIARALNKDSNDGE